MSSWSFRTDRYGVEVSSDGRWATVWPTAGGPRLRLCLLASLATLDGPDETVAAESPEVTDGPLGPGPGPAVRVRRRSTRWAEAATVVECGPEGLTIRAEVTGTGRLTGAVLLGGMSVMADAMGPLHSGAEVKYLFSPNPEDPRLVVHPAGSPAVVSAGGDSLPGRGHWFFTPAPLYFALGEASSPGAALGAGAGPGPAGWAGLGLLGPVQEADFTAFSYVPVDQGFHLRLDYEGHRHVDGTFGAPAVLVLPGLDNPYEGIRAQRRRLVADGSLPSAGAGPEELSRVPERPAWWSQPMFCGWGAQCYLAKQHGTSPQEECSSANYDRFLGELGRHGVHPATVVIDDGWQSQYGKAVPDPLRWPDLGGWISARRQEGRRVLVWWKAWDPSGVPPEWCVTNPDGAPVAIDPAHPSARRLLEENVNRILSTDGFDADGLKVDFTGRTPTGTALAHAGTWGLALLHEHLDILYRSAKKAKPEALVITHTANPAFSDVSDMVRLNDILRLDEANPESPVVYQMKYRASVARAACPDLLIDTDDWCAPNLAQWREYMSVKADIGVPALYYTTHLDRTGEAFQEADYELVRQVFSTASKESS